MHMTDQSKYTYSIPATEADRAAMRLRFELEATELRLEMHEQGKARLKARAVRCINDDYFPA